MPSAEVSVVIDRPVGEVFEFVSDPATAIRWISGVIESGQTSEGPMGVGTVCRTSRRFLGRQIDSTWEITEYEPHTRYSFKSTSGPIRFQGSDTFEAFEGGTKLTFAVEAVMGGFFRMAEPLLVRMATRQFESDLANLKDLMESGEA